MKLCSPLFLALACASGAQAFAQVSVSAAPATRRAAQPPPAGQYLSQSNYLWDDATSEAALGLTTPQPPQGVGGLAWFQYFDTQDPAGANGPSDIITHVEVAMGSPLFAPAAPAAGTTYEVYVYDDPNDDGQPNDLVLLTRQEDTLMAPDRDAIQPTPIPPTSVQGQFVVACFVRHEIATNPPTPGVGEFPAALDQGQLSAGRAWIAGMIPDTNWDPTQPNAPYAFPLSELDSIGQPGVWLMRAFGNGGPGASAYCTAKSGLVCGTPSIRADGMPSVGLQSGFVVRAGPARSCRSGILVYNTAPGIFPFQGGTLCVDAMGLRRAGSTNSGGTQGNNCDGEFAVDMNAFAANQWQVPDCGGAPSGIPASSPAAFLSIPGTQVFCQFWGRDSQGTGSFLSDALSYVIGAATNLSRGAGVDLYQSDGLAHLDLPADFFTPGSDPFIGTVQLGGQPLGTRNAHELGTTDTVIERLDRMDLFPEPSISTVPIQIVELSLVSIQPIQVTVNGQPELWDVQVELSPDPPEFNGVMRIDRGAPNGGVLETIVPVRPILTFTRGGNTATLDPGTVPLVGGGTWVADPLCPSLQLATPWLPIGFCQSQQLSSPLLDLSLDPAQPDPGAPPPAFVDPSANVHPSARLGRNCVIGANAQVGANAVIGPDAFVGDFAVVGDGSLLGANARLEAGSNMGNQSVVDDGTIVQGAVFADDTTIGSLCVVEVGVAVTAPFCYVGDGSFLGAGAQLGGGVDCGEGVNIGPNATIAAGVRLADGANVAPGSFQNEDVVECRDVNGVVTVVPESLCPANEAILGHLPLSIGTRVTPEADKEVIPISKVALPARLANLANDINMAGVAPMKNGGPAPNYVKDTNDCDDFAERLEVALQKKGYDATFTIVWKVNKDRGWGQFWKKRFLSGHCLTDVHHDGKTIWIEAQFTAPAGIGVNIDDDGDGKVEYTDKGGYSATDGDLRIEVYKNRKDAEKQWGDLD